MVYLPNPNFERELQEEGGTTGALEAAAESAKSNAETVSVRIMPRNASTAFEVQVDEDGAVRLANTDYGGHLAEWGSVNNPAYAPLRRAVAAAGLRFEESAKA